MGLFKTKEEREFNKLLKQSKEGNPDTLCILGVLYEYGIGTEINLESAYNAYLSAAEKGNRVAAFKVGNWIYQKLKPELIRTKRWPLSANTQKDNPQPQEYAFVTGTMDDAVRWLKMAAEKGVAEACNLIGEIRIDAVPENIGWYIKNGLIKGYDWVIGLNAEDWLEKSASAGNAEGQTLLAKYYSIRGEYKKKYEVCKNAIYSNNYSAMFELGRMLLDPRIYDKAEKKLEAVRKDIPEYMNYLEAMKYIRIAYKNGCGDSGIQSDSGIKNPEIMAANYCANLLKNYKDKQEADKFVAFLKSKLFDSEFDIQFGLAEYYKDENEEDSFFYFLKAGTIAERDVGIEEDKKVACFAYLGEMFADGKGAERDPDKAMYWLGKINLMPKNHYSEKEEKMKDAVFITCKLLCTDFRSKENYDLVINHLGLESSDERINSLLGDEHFYGRVNEVPDYETAAKYYSRCNGKDGHALYMLGKMYEEGLYYEKDIKKAYSKYSWSLYYYDNISACNAIVRIYETGYQDNNTWYTEALKRIKTNDAQFKLGKIRIQKDWGVIRRIDYEYYMKPFSEIDKTKPYNKDLDYYMALVYSRYEDCDKQKAIQQFEAITETETAEAMIGIGDYLCVNSPSEKAVYWYVKAGETGNSEGFLKAGKCYEEGNGVGQDFEKALRYYVLSAENGNSEGMYKAGWYFLEGKGCNPDTIKAVEYLENASENGFLQAKVRLAYVYTNEIYLEDICDETRSEQFLKKAKSLILYAIKQCEGLDSKELQKLFSLYGEHLSLAIQQYVMEYVFHIVRNINSNTLSHLLRSDNDNRNLPDIKDFFPDEFYRWEREWDNYYDVTIPMYTEAIRLEDKGDTERAILLYYYAAALENKNAIYTLINMSMEESNYFD